MWAKILRIFLLFYMPILIITLIFGNIERSKRIQHLQDLENRAATYRKNILSDLFQRLVYNVEYWSDINYPENFNPKATDSSFMKPYYDIMDGISNYYQFRFIDLKGNEILRYERDPATNKLKEGPLQNKSQRNYFKEGLLLNKEEVFLSKISLNREYGQIQHPYVPVIRGIAPIYSASGNQLGIVIINFNLTAILDKLEDRVTESDFYLIDHNHNIITSNTNQLKLAYELIEELDINNNVRLINKGFTQFKDTTFTDSRGLWSFNRIDLTEGYGKSRSNFISQKEVKTASSWAIVHQIPKTLLKQKLLPLYRDFLIFNSFAIITILLCSYFLIKKRTQKQEFYKTLEIKNTKLLLSEEALQKNNSKILEINRILERRNQQLEEFNYLVSHNLRAPITSMSMIVGLIEETKDPEQLLILMPKLSQITNTISEISEDIREYVTILNKSQIDIETFDIKTVVEHVKNEFSEILLNPNDFQIKYDFQAWQQLSFSKFYFKSIIQNLISNAIKYRRDNVNSSLLFKTAWENGDKVLYIEDNGRGIDTNRHGKDMFKLYKRFHRDVSGKGMGLFLVKSQLESLDSEIVVESKVNQGSTFKITFKNERQI